MPYTHRKVGDKQCVFKKEDGSKVGCTSGSIQKYLGALHANANESVNETSESNNETIINFIKTLEVENLFAKDSHKNQNLIKTITDIVSMSDLDYSIYIKEHPNRNVQMIRSEYNDWKQSNIDSVTETNILKGGKADKIKTIEDLYNYWADKGYASGGISKSLKKELYHEIALGKQIESEHTSDEEKILEIVFDHLVEDKNYYTKAKPKNWAEKEISQEMTESTKSLIKRLIREKIG